MQTASSKILTRVTISISYDDNQNTLSASKIWEKENDDQS